MSDVIDFSQAKAAKLAPPPFISFEPTSVSEAAIVILGILISAERAKREAVRRVNFDAHDKASVAIREALDAAAILLEGRPVDIDPLGAA